MNSTDGFLCIDKPCGPSSFSVVAALRRVLGCGKAGHAGTLDPAASGLLVVAIGQATRLISLLPLEPKVYHFGIQFGSQTDTLDAQGTVVKTGGMVPGRDELEAALPFFTGTITQVPPGFSSVKIKGVRAYKLARQGKHPVLAERTIAVHSIRTLSYDRPKGQAFLEVSCSGGTYVRSLAQDIAVRLGTLGHACSVRRMAAGRFTVDSALAFADIGSAKDALVPCNKAFEGLPGIVVDEREKRRIVTGNDILINENKSINGGVVFAYDKEQRLLAVLRRTNDRHYHPDRVFVEKNNSLSLSHSFPDNGGCRVVENSSQP